MCFSAHPESTGEKTFKSYVKFWLGFLGFVFNFFFGGVGFLGFGFFCIFDKNTK